MGAEGKVGTKDTEDSVLVVFGVRSDKKKTTIADAIRQISGAEGFVTVDCNNELCCGVEIARFDSSSEDDTRCVDMKTLLKKCDRMSSIAGSSLKEKLSFHEVHTGCGSIKPYTGKTGWGRNGKR